jgi:hypothetical protein
MRARIDMTRAALGVLVIIAGCGTALPEEGELAGERGKFDQIGASDDPNKLLDGATFRLGDLIGAEDVGKTFGVDDDHIPYPDTFWPVTQGGIDARWKQGQPSPLDKYLKVADPWKLSQAKTWERVWHGAAVIGAQPWFGHCPGWTGAAMMNAPLKRAVHARYFGKKKIASCDPEKPGAQFECVTFEIGDINALMAEVYTDGVQHLLGARCDKKLSEIKRDQYGRVVDKGCKGLNAGALLVVAGNLMKLRRKPFGIDAQNEYSTDEIWNQPAYRYKVYRYEALAEAEAANLVASGKREGELTAYGWNAAAKGWLLVDLGLQWVRERGPNTTFISGADSTGETRMVAVIELDSEPSDDSTIIGGEYLDDDSVGANRLKVPPYVWIATDQLQEELQQALHVDGLHHNPWVYPSVVKQLVAMAQ